MCKKNLIDFDTLSIYNIVQIQSTFKPGTPFERARDVLFEFHLEFWYTASIGIPVRSLKMFR